MFPRRYDFWMISLLVTLTAGWCFAQIASDPSGHQTETLRASVWVESASVLTGERIWAVFMLTNLTDEPITIGQPHDSEAASPDQGSGLSLYQVFSGPDHTALAVEDAHGKVFGLNMTVKPPKSGIGQVRIAPQSCVGRRMELTRYYDALTRPGTYRITWRPFEGELRSSPVSIDIMPEQQARIITDVGDMVMRFNYDRAPEHVKNFIELARSGFYDNLTFHRIVPGGLIQGGSPTGDNYGLRPDGKRLKAEFSDIPFARGVVGMARAASNPDSASCQFFICLARQPGFDRKQTAFGYLHGEKSLETLKLIESTPTEGRGRPIKKVYIRAISLENVPMLEREVSGASRLDRPRQADRSVAVTPSGTYIGEARDLSRNGKRAPENQPEMIRLPSSDTLATQTAPAVEER